MLYKRLIFKEFLFKCIMHFSSFHKFVHSEADSKGFELNARPRLTIKNHECRLTPTVLLN